VQLQRVSLRSLAGVQEGRTWQSEVLLRVGRLPTCAVVLDDTSVSRQHAEVAFTRKGWVVRDLGSKNGTFLNGTRIGRAEQYVRRGDILQFGDITLIVDNAESAAEEVPPKAESVKQVVTSVTTSWEELPKVLASATTEGDFAKDPLVTLVQTGRDFYRFTSMDDYVQSILWEAAEATDSRQGAILLRDEMTGNIYPRAIFALGETPSTKAWTEDFLVRHALDKRSSFLWQHHLTGPASQAGERRSIIYALLRSPRETLGVMGLARGADQQPFGLPELQLVDALALSVSASIDSMGHLLDKQRTMFLQTLTALTQVVELRGGAIYGQSQRVTDYALLIAEELQLSDNDYHLLRIGVPLRDLGKLAVADGLLLKPGALTPGEKDLIRMQVLKGIGLLETIPGLANVMPLVRSHREHWDGNGYPDGLRGEEIPLLARIVHVAEALEALTADRPYRRALPLPEAFAEIERQTGKQFDPACVVALARVRERIENLAQERIQSTDTMSLDTLQQAVGSLGNRRRLPDRKPGERTPLPGLSA
jgi:HD-GYP domain-containing protein (c-di-GMP phosphodiesterase class II)